MSLVKTDDYGKSIKPCIGGMFYCLHKPTKSLVYRDVLGGIKYVNNPNDMSFLIEGAWEEVLKYRNDKHEFEIISFTI